MTALFSPDQWQRVQSVLAGLDQRQALWLSGYLAASREAPVPSQARAADSAVQITIAYGSETGNSTAIAENLKRLLQGQNIEARLLPLAEVKVRTLARVQYLWIVCSTHGDGDPPEPATPFFEALLSDQAPALKTLKYAVLALGDSTYEHFCTAGLALDRRLAELGAERMLPCVECDVDFKGASDAWVDKVSGLVPRTATADLPLAAIPVAQTEGVAAPTRTNPVELEVLENICLTAPSRRAAVHHLSLLIENDDLQLQPGDAVGVLPHNPPELVAAVLNMSGLSGDDAVVVDDQAMPLVQALREKLDLTIPGKPLLQLLAELTGDAQLQQINANSKAQRELLRASSVLDILRQYPATLDTHALTAALRPLQPRLYDIANAPGDDELHLTVQTYWYPHPGSASSPRTAPEGGIASRYLTQLQPGERVRLYPHHNKRFRLPEDREVPLIWIASSTGVAPYRAFVQSMAAEGRSHPCWLLLREQRFEEDFLYQTDWQAAARNGVLTKISTEFHEDQPHTRLEDALTDGLADWVARGAHVYLCGDQEPMAELVTRLKESPEVAAAWATLSAEKRLHRNLY